MDLATAVGRLEAAGTEGLWATGNHDAPGRSAPARSARRRA
jgi:hypothetical protein